ncbi:MAG: sulfotransferase [Acidobacteria bacterium]|nr:sulfotransferase [Acidobacteriota bacterium]MBV9476216.1 sulfotransferase [Acidobacteriota bacterium]
MIDGAVFVSGAQRSGTTLLEKLLGMQPQVSMLSQPFPFLFVETKRAFLGTLDDGGGDSYPLGHLFHERRYTAAGFAAFLASWRTNAETLAAQFAAMRSYSGQYARFDTETVGTALASLPRDSDFAAVISSLARALAPDPSAPFCGLKETVSEEYMPALCSRGFRCAIIIRDPRDVLASLNHGRGREFGGELKPTLFNIRNWRKSVAIALSLESEPRFHWCRYEDLVDDPSAELARLGDRLELGTMQAREELVDADGQRWRGNSSFADHDGVSGASVSRYRDTLPDDVARYVEAACLPELRLLGYESSLGDTDATRVLRAFREPYTIVRAGFDDDAATPANAAREIERLERVSAFPDGESRFWFLSETAHRKLREGPRR